MCFLINLIVVLFKKLKDRSGQMWTEADKSGHKIGVL